MHPIIDTHCHLYADQFNDDRDLVIQNAMDAGISTFLLPNIDLDSIPGLYALADKYPENCFPMMGLHPCSVDAGYKKTLDLIYKELQSRKFIAIGEIGLDYYWDVTYKAEQLDAFATQMKWASELKLPVAIHTRNSFEDAFASVAKAKEEGITGVFHCFSGTAEDAKRIVDIDFFMGIGGVLTFKNGGIDKVLPDVPMKFLILETDAPYLAPVPNRGKRNEPKYLVSIAQKLGDIKEMTLENIAEITSGNAGRLFKL
jgi:TatD DNase family protein